MYLNDVEMKCLDVLMDNYGWMSYVDLVRLTGLDSADVNAALDALLDYELIEEGVRDYAHLKISSESLFRDRRNDNYQAGSVK